MTHGVAYVCMGQKSPPHPLKLQSSIKKAKQDNYHDGPVNSLKGEENILEYTRERQKQLPNQTLGSLPVVLYVCSVL